MSHEMSTQCTVPMLKHKQYFSRFYTARTTLADDTDCLGLNYILLPPAVAHFELQFRE